jgi:hypothetical protein
MATPEYDRRAYKRPYSTMSTRIQFGSVYTMDLNAHDLSREMSEYSILFRNTFQIPPQIEENYYED